MAQAGVLPLFLHLIGFYGNMSQNITNEKRAVYSEDVLSRSSGWPMVHLRHCAEVPVGGAVGAHPVVVLTAHIGRVHRCAPATRSATASDVQRVVAALGQVIGVVHTPVAVGPHGSPTIGAGVCVNPDANFCVVAVEALDRATDRAARRRSARSSDSRHSETHQQGGSSYCELLSDSFDHDSLLPDCCGRVDL